MKTLNVFIDEVDPAGLQGHLRTEIATAETVVRQAGLAIEAIDTRLSADMHYAGQTPRSPSHCRRRAMRR